MDRGHVFVVIAGRCADELQSNQILSVGNDITIFAERSCATNTESSGISSQRDSLRFSFRWAVYYGIGGIPGGVILTLFGLAALAPACYAAWVYGQKLSTHWPRLGQTGWTWIGGAISLVMGATSCVNRLDWIFIVMGLLFAPPSGRWPAIGCVRGEIGRGYVWVSIVPGSSPGSRALGSRWHLKWGN